MNLSNLRAAGISTYLQKGGSVEKLAAITGMSIRHASLYVDRSEHAVLFEGDLNELLDHFGDSVSSPLLEHFRRAGTFRLSVITDKQKTEPDASEE